MKFNANKCAKFSCGADLGEKESSNLKYKDNVVLTCEHQKKNSHSKDAFDGLVGVFKPTSNDFTLFNDDENGNKQGEKHFVDDPLWTSERRAQVKKFRFRVCSFALFAMTFGLMSRLVFNFAIVEMTKSGSRATTPITTTESMRDATIELDAARNEFVTYDYAAIEQDEQQQDEGAPLDWPMSSQNLLLSAFYFGYTPSMLLSGSVAENYGSKYPLLIAILGSALINLLTPIVARYSFVMLLLLRVLLGVLQGGLMPSLYDLFNKWLTLTELSIFVPLIKVFAAFGTLGGASLPGLASQLGLKWPAIYYMAGFVCAVWALIWIPLATSTPQASSYVQDNECQWIMRKKKQFKPGNSLENNLKLQAQNNSVGQKQTGESHSTPWLLIITNPSVLALTLVKFSYNIGVDFLVLELAIYLRQVHQASAETISAVASSGALLQMALVTFAGWLARVLVHKRALGLSRTKWRKIFQGSSNFIMALGYFCLSYAGTDLSLATPFILMIFLFWVLGAGGESMVPYDLSSRYPATILGLTHSFSVLSGITLPTLCGLVLGDEGDNEQGWSFLFRIVGSIVFVGGLVFCCVLKAKPFLPGETEKSSK